MPERQATFTHSFRIRLLLDRCARRMRCRAAQECLGAARQRCSADDHSGASGSAGGVPCEPGGSALQAVDPAPPHLAARPPWYPAYQRPAAARQPHSSLRSAPAPDEFESSLSAPPPLYPAHWRPAVAGLPRSSLQKRSCAASRAL